jgi:glycosyltransferase involved in cell wall biosynthesis
LGDARVTALMPIRDYHPAYLERALASVLRQTSPNWRLLVIDDGADAGLAGALDGLLGDDRMRLVPSDSRGFASALNTGLRAAGTDFVSVLFGDDMWSDDALGVLTSFVDRFDTVDVFHASRIFVDEHDRPISGVYRARESFSLSDFLDGSPVKHPMCFRRELALGVGGLDESLGPIGIDDFDLPWSLAAGGARFMAIPDCTYLVRDHRDSFRLTTHVPRSVQIRTIRRIMRKHGAGRAQVDAHVSRLKGRDLRQCLYRSRVDRWLKQRLGRAEGPVWRESYQ